MHSPCRIARGLSFNPILGVTTNSASGITSYDEFFPVFAAMEKHDLVLNLHGEVPSSPGSDITDLTAEEAFLPTLIELNQRFPKLRIVLEHCSTAAAIAAVSACGPSVVCKLPQIKNYNHVPPAAIAA